MRLCSIASGSNGNAVYVGNKNTNLLVDAGISRKRIEEGLSSLGVEPQRLDAILITHEHIDHISGLGVMSRQYHLPVYATKETIIQILNTPSIKDIDETLFVEILPESKFKIKDITIEAFSVYHDAANPVAYRFDSGDKSAGILTDCGKYDDRILSHLKGVNTLLLEANHDVHMLCAGRYPYKVKQRILSDTGHLSNESSGRFLSRLLDENLKYVILGHLSQNNNFEELAYETVRAEVDLSESPYSSSDFNMYVANGKSISKVVEI